MKGFENEIAYTHFYFGTQYYIIGNVLELACIALLGFQESCHSAVKL